MTDHVYLNFANSEPTAILVECPSATVNGVQVSRTILDAWSDAELSALGIVRAPVDDPDHDENAIPTGYAPIETGGAWVYRRQYRDPTAEEAARRKAEGWQAVRVNRDALLSATDALLLRHQDQIALVDAGRMATTALTDDQIADLRAYRQTLRDLPQSHGAPDADPSTVVWPDTPTSIQE